MINLVTPFIKKINKMIPFDTPYACPESQKLKMNKLINFDNRFTRPQTQN
jgi:hypothetical protein